MTAGLPDFLVLGTPKAGTTSFHHYLSHHPEVFLPERKEVHHFSSPELRRYVAGPGDRRAAEAACASEAEYRALFAAARPGQRLGEASPSYFYFTETYQRIRGVLGHGTKVLVLFRNPVDRAFSNYLHLRRSGREELPFGEALEAEDDRIARGYGDFWRYRDHSRYAARLERLLDVFPAEDVLLLSFHELTSDPVAVVQRACRFLGIDDTYVPPNTDRTYNTGSRTRTGAVATWLVKPSPVKTALKRLVGPGVADRVRAARDVALAGGGLPELDVATFERLRDELSSEVAALRDHHGLDVSMSRYEPTRSTS